MKFTGLIEARKALNPLWKIAQLKGRCWGPKLKNDNPFFGSNITLAAGDNLVSVSQDPDGNLRIHQFIRTKTTMLGNAVKEIFKKENLNFKEV